MISRLFRRRTITTTGCWIWQGSRDGKGYGKIRVRGILRAVHRVAYEVLVGPIDHGMVLDHLCRNKACFNPEHLEPVTQSMNLRRGQGIAGQTHCINGHDYNSVNTYTDDKGRRHCRICRRAVERRKYERRKQKVTDHA